MSELGTNTVDTRPKCYGCIWFVDDGGLAMSLPHSWNRPTVPPRYTCRHRNRGQSLVTYGYKARPCEEARADPNDCGPDARWRDVPWPDPPPPPPRRRRGIGFWARLLGKR